MTSRTGPKRTRAAAASRGFSRVSRVSRVSRRRHGTDQPAWLGPRAGFTLIEIVLSLAILALLTGMSILSFASMMHGADLDEGALQFEGMLRTARSDAALKGRRMRIVFSDGEDGDGSFAVYWEQDPLTQPGVFEAYHAASWASRLPDALVRVTRCRLTGPSAYRTLISANPDNADDPDVLEAITFYPDGSCDSAAIELAGMDETDSRRALIDLNGFSGTITRRVLTQKELEDLENE